MLQGLLTLYAFMALTNIFLMMFLHFHHNRRGYYLKALLVWTGLFVGFFMDGVVSTHFGLPHDIYGIVFLSLTTFGLASLSNDIYDLKLSVRPYLFFLGACWVCALIAHYVFDAPLMVSSSFICTGITLPTFGLIKAIRKTGRNSLNVLDKLFLGLVILESIHLLDYPFVRDMELALIPGFSLGMFLIFCCSIIMPIVINQKIHSNLSLDLVNAKERAEVANKAKSVFLANISHELRTPMHGILSFASIAMKKENAAPVEDLKGYFAEIYDSGCRLMNLLNDLLDLAKLESGKMTYDMQEDDVLNPIYIVQSEFSSMAKARGNELRVECQKKLIAQFDRDRITQVLRNLVSNAIKFSDLGSPIKISAYYVDLNLHVCVEDQGILIRTEELESIFDKFAQSSNTRKKSGGTGLGLAICREIILAHGGRIWAESSESGLTRVHFEIPTLLNKSGEQAA